MGKQTRVRPIADGSHSDVTTLDAGKFQLTSGRLTLVSITLAGISTGPVRANAVIEFDNSTANRMSLGEPVWLRSDTVFGHRDTFIWNGEIDVDRDDHLLFSLRNDSGAAAIWKAGWIID